MGGQRRLWGLYVRLDEVPELIDAAKVIRDAGYTRWDCHTPFPVHGLNEAMGLRLTRLPLVVFAAGAAGAIAGVAMQWWMNAVDYPLIISGKPFFSLPANIPIVFEMTILFAAITAFVGMLAFNGLPRHHHPLFAVDEFRAATDDKFFIVIEADDPRFDENAARQLLGRFGEVREVWE
ncbi:MAG: DUF3341 domain-containing protein [Acidobacteriota bacterium]